VKRIIRKHKPDKPNAKAMRKTYEQATTCQDLFGHLTKKDWDRWVRHPRYICTFCQKDFVKTWWCPECKGYKGILPYFPSVDYGFGAGILGE